jgi:hypothetical protein
MCSFRIFSDFSGFFWIEIQKIRFSPLGQESYYHTISLPKTFFIASLLHRLISSSLHRLISPSLHRFKISIISFE